MDGGTEEVGLNLGNSDSSGPLSATLQRDVSVARWQPEVGMAEVLVQRGKVWGSMGVIRNSKLYCHVEEATYLVEHGILLLSLEDRVMPLHDVYDLLVAPAHGCSWDAYQIFSHLKRLGYIVGRHDTLWTNSSASRKLTPMDACAMPGLENEVKLGPEMLANLRLSNEGLGDACFKQKEGCELNIIFDVHHPNGRFKKTAPGSPAFSLCIVGGNQPPKQSQVRALELRVGNTPLKFGFVDSGHVSIFSFTSCTLPTLL